MSEHIVTSPDGRKFKVNAPDGATQEQIIAYAQQSMGTPASAPVKPVTASERGSAVTTGFNSGLASLAGLPVDTAMNIWDLAKAGAGTIQGAVTGKPPSDIFEPSDRANYIGSSEYIKNLMNKSQATNTHLPRPDDAASRYLYAVGSALPGAMLAQPSTAGQTVAAVTQNVVPTLAAQSAADKFKGTPYETTAPILASLTAQALPSAVSYAAKSLTPKPDESTAQAAKTLEDAGVQLDAAQKTGSEGLKSAKRLATDNPFTGPAQIRKAQQQSKQYTKAVLKTIGEDAAAATPEVIDRADRRIGGTIAEISDRTPVKYNKSLHTGLSDVMDEAQRILPPEDLATLGKQIDFLQSKVTAGQKGPVIDGQIMQTIRSELGMIAKDGGRLGYVAGNLQSVIDDSIQANAAPGDYAKLKQARQQYRALQQIVPAIDKNGDGTISPARLANSLPRGNAGKKQFFYGRGDQSLVNLAKAGNKLLPDKAPNSGTSARGMLQYLPGALVGSAAHLAGGNPIPAAALGVGTFALPKVLQGILNSPTALTGQQQISDPRMLQYAAQQGLLSNMSLNNVNR